MNQSDEVATSLSRDRVPRDRGTSHSRSPELPLRCEVWGQESGEMDKCVLQGTKSILRSIWVDSAP